MRELVLRVTLEFLHRQNCSLFLYTVSRETLKCSTAFLHFQLCISPLYSSLFGNEFNGHVLLCVCLPGIMMLAAHEGFIYWNYGYLCFSSEL